MKCVKGIKRYKFPDIKQIGHEDIISLQYGDYSQ